MVLVKLLHNLQEMDIDISQQEATLAQIQQRLTDERFLVKARQSVYDATQKLQSLQLQQKDAETMCGSLAGKIQKLNQQLYNGAIRNIKELNAMQDELSYLDKNQQETEEALLTTMVESEDCQRSVNTREQHYQELAANWDREKKDLYKEMEGLDTDLERSRRQRQLVSDKVDKGALTLYERLRKSHGGRAVARIERGMCQVCHISLPTKELQQARTSEELVRCSSCGRILLAS